ncbi:hypothetical protein [Actinoallomurus soli]|uniref:hypothetical protein n=1 Tax=Actinoallomurus soli TaxID=2952535 RepID=UPI002091E61A|nr:hypothetical protein [Actinoallomurus soli]MCO5970675.1 hypothetical protein [Actinoallomurus soli]
MALRLRERLDPQPRDWYNDANGTAANGGCSAHGTPPCHEPIVASLILEDSASDDIRWAVCRRGLEPFLD